MGIRTYCGCTAATHDENVEAVAPWWNAEAEAVRAAGSTDELEAEAVGRLRLGASSSPLLTSGRTCCSGYCIACMVRCHASANKLCTPARHSPLSFPPLLLRTEGMTQVLALT